MKRSRRNWQDPSIRIKVVKGSRFRGRDSTGSRFEGWLVIRDAGRFKQIVSFHDTKADAEKAAKMERDRFNPARRVRKSTGWIKATAVRVERRGGQYVVKVKR